MDEPVELPVLTEALLPFLDALIPPRCIGKAQTLEEAHRYAGARDLVEQLIEIWKDQTDIERKAIHQGGDGAA